MNCLWCRGTVHQRAGYNSPDFCCQRCEHRFYSTGHLLEEDRQREDRMKAEAWRAECDRDLAANHRKVAEAKNQEAKEHLGYAIMFALFGFCSLGLAFAFAEKVCG